MPDLNLQDEEGSLESFESSGGEGLRISEERGVPRKKGSALAAFLVVILVLIIGAGGTYLLNELGIVKLWGKKPAPAVVQMQEQPLEEQRAVTALEDTAQLSMIETPPLGESRSVTGKAARPSGAPREVPASSAGPKLGEMKGEYTVQVSAWRDEATAQEMVGRLQEAGYPAFVEGRSYRDGTWFTVRIGRYPSPKDAQLAVQNFAEELRSSHWIDRIRAR